MKRFATLRERCLVGFAQRAAPRRRGGETRRPAAPVQQPRLSARSPAAEAVGEGIFVRDACRELEYLLYHPPMDDDDLYDAIRAFDDVTDCVVAGLRQKAGEGDWSGFGRYLWAAFGHPAPEMTPVLIDALARRESSVPNEDIVELLRDLADPRAFEVLRETLWWNPDWDEAHAIAVKCVYALARLSIAEDAIRDAAARGSAPVRQAATGVLAYGIG